jgi:hypothetical protein
MSCSRGIAAGTYSIAQIAAKSLVVSVRGCSAFTFDAVTWTDPPFFCCLVGANLLVEEAKVEFPKGKDGVKVYVVRRWFLTLLLLGLVSIPISNINA